MKLRTVLSELPIRGFDVADDVQLGWDMVVSPEWGVGERAEGVIRLGSRADLAQEGAPGQGEGLLLVYAQGGEEDAMGAGARAPRESGVVYCWGDLAPSEFQDAFLGLVRRSGELGARRNQLFDCFLESYDMRQFAQRAAAVLENPVIISNTEHKILATAGTLPTSDDVCSSLEAGYITPEVERRMREDGVISSVRNARHSVLSERAGEKDRAVTSIIYHHRLEMGRFDVFEVTHAMTGLDLELVDFASDLAGIMIDRLGAAGGRLGKGSSILKDVLEGTFVSEDALRCAPGPPGPCRGRHLRAAVRARPCGRERGVLRPRRRHRSEGHAGRRVVRLRRRPRAAGGGGLRRRGGLRRVRALRAAALARPRPHADACQQRHARVHERAV